MEQRIISVDFGKREETGFDYAQYRERAYGRYLAAKRRRAAVAIAESLSSIVIAVSCILSVIIVLSMG